MTQSLTQETEQRTTHTQRSKFSPALKRKFLKGMVECLFYCSLLNWPKYIEKYIWAKFFRERTQMLL